MPNPKIRFNDFCDTWQKGNLKDLITLFYGKDHKALADGNYPVLGSGGVMRHIDSFLYDKPSVLIGRKGTIDKPQFINEPFWTVDTLFYTEIKAHCSPYFVFCLSQTINWKKYNEATGVPSLNSTGIYSIPVAFPAITEQQKIADFLISVDTKISQLTEKHRLLKEYKKGVMQQIFSQQIRFKDENGKAFPEWTEFALKTLLILQSDSLDMQDDDTYELITVKRGFGGVVSRGLFKGKDVLVKNQFTIHENEFVISKRQIVHGACGLVPASLEGAIVSNEYNVFRPEEKLLDIDYFNLLASTPLMRKAFFINSDGVHIEKLLFKTQSWLKTKVQLPCLEEQQKITQFLQVINQKIDAVAKQLEQTKQFKKGLLQQMFV
ncbi:restriction endonuclease subunit S [Vibrio scophthalmi]|uniref:restriction endonuclease subunit S n=1 Tax=Vibrio scophthalmi TaxID=45658 RepID=UPI003872FCFB